MTLTKSFLCIASALALGSGPTAFAGEDSSANGSVETSPPELLSEESLEPMDSAELESYEGVSMEEYEVVYVVPMEITEYYFAVPKHPDEAPG